MRTYSLLIASKVERPPRNAIDLAESQFSGFPPTPAPPASAARRGSLQLLFQRAYPQCVSSWCCDWLVGTVPRLLDEDEFPRLPTKWVLGHSKHALSSSHIQGPRAPKGRTQVFPGKRSGTRAVFSATYEPPLSAIPRSPLEHPRCRRRDSHLAP